ncbi:hypothetical protein DSM106972_017300 [Dulcicalothrix desertica PCC 7102]|uniref:ARG and Rhodanese-Phosphatase-superfamily-associated domain-containing protein n=1 Tax=Dulcicalothrix desertica PCC 7102 TaxID=232991 RepID=A0A3S1CSP0_9CYAN|nr:hypothetical protein [Dulcicalothrix desertica]RUT08562.1 hypothetical protein DSM106972_017300 [Dulcicalothrix desertica PCC 7102]TWH44040.1 hypothetical protein CAL7102_07809 [Dulcicalothrix desertica PCC 7102]
MLLKGLEVAPSQICGSIRIVPLIRRKIRGDLRLQRRNYDAKYSIVSLEDDMQYMSYIPHGMVMSWNDDGSAVANIGANIIKKDGKSGKSGRNVQVMQRMAKRETKNSLRFLPLHLAMEGFLSLYFNAPKIAWEEYSRYALTYGLGCRSEYSYSGRAIVGLEEALRVFEIHPNQVGVLIYVADALASAFVVSIPEDYLCLHYNLLEDFYGELIYQYASLYDKTYEMSLSIDDKKVNNLADLRSAVAKMRSNWATFHQEVMSTGLIGRSVKSKTVYTAGRFELQRFMTNVNSPLDVNNENHIGEVILRDNGEVEYLHTYRLSQQQINRVYYLGKLDENNWNISQTAKALLRTDEEFILIMEELGFGYLFAQQLRDKARKKVFK